VKGLRHLGENKGKLKMKKMENSGEGRGETLVNQPKGGAQKSKTRSVPEAGSDSLQPTLRGILHNQIKREHLHNAEWGRERIKGANEALERGFKKDKINPYRTRVGMEKRACWYWKKSKRRLHGDVRIGSSQMLGKWKEGHTQEGKGIWH